MNVEKVTAFITRKRNQYCELLLIQHPNAGIQIPAGTVEKEENVKEALMREVTEETGLRKIAIMAYLGFKDYILSHNQFLTSEKSKVYSRPDSNSPDLIDLKRGITVITNRTINNFSQITYSEYDKYPNPQFVTYSITGWVLTNILAKEIRRHFFHLEINEKVQDEWEKLANNHIFRLFWSPLTSLPEIVDSQQQWLEFVREAGYSFY